VVTKFESVSNKLSFGLLLTQLHKSYLAASRLIFRQKPIRTRKAQCLTSRYFSPLSFSLYSSSPGITTYTSSLHSFSCFSFDEFCPHLYYLLFLTLSLTSLLILLDLQVFPVKETRTEGIHKINRILERNILKITIAYCACSV